MAEFPDPSAFFKNYGEIASTDKRRELLKVLSDCMLALNPATIVAGMKEKIDEFEKEKPLHVFGFGKATFSMYKGIATVAGKRLKSSAIIIPDDEPVDEELPGLEILRGNHPYATSLSEESGRKLLALLDQAPAGDAVVFLISGGGSAIFEVPESGLKIDEIAEVTKCLMNSGADINQLNCVRSSLSAVKGGKLCKRLKNGHTLALYISDVPKDDLAYIASGPFVPISGSCDPISLLEEHGCASILPADFQVQRSEESCDGRVENILLLRNYDFVNRIAKSLRSQGHDVLDLGSNMGGDVAEFVDSLYQVLRSNYRLRGTGFWFVGGAETTVEVRGHGKGGRCQESCLYFLKKCRENEDFVYIAAGTDGIDGQSSAMGGIADTELLRVIKRDEIESSLQQSDSNTLLTKHHSSIYTGRTGNNVSDIFLGYYSEKEKLDA